LGDAALRGEDAKYAGYSVDAKTLLNLTQK